MASSRAVPSASATSRRAQTSRRSCCLGVSSRQQAASLVASCGGAQIFAAGRRRSESSTQSSRADRASGRQSADMDDQAASRRERTSPAWPRIVRCVESVLGSAPTSRAISPAAASRACARPAPAGGTPPGGCHAPARESASTATGSCISSRPGGLVQQRTGAQQAVRSHGFGWRAGLRPRHKRSPRRG